MPERSPDRRRDLVAHAVVDEQPFADFPTILHIEIERVATNPRLADVFALREHHRRDRQIVCEGACGQRPGERIRQRIPDMNIVQAACRVNFNR